MLYIYTNKKEVPDNLKVVNYNDLFFNSFELKQDNMTERILYTIDRATYGTADSVYGRDKSIGLLNKDCLSTGCKTLLNIYYFPDICFDLTECGDNVLELLPIIKNGNVIWSYPRILDVTCDCDIMYNNHHYDRYEDFLTDFGTK